MQIYRFSGFEMVGLVLKAGENLNSVLEATLAQLGAGFMVVPNLQAQFDRVDLGFYVPARAAYDHYEFSGLTLGREAGTEDRYSKLEPGSVSGNVGWVGDKPFAHVHGSFFSGLSEISESSVGASVSS